jgi:hypothetical protein
MRSGSAKASLWRHCRTTNEATVTELVATRTASSFEKQVLASVIAVFSGRTGKESNRELRGRKG